jgi:hypothetical protein
MTPSELAAALGQRGGRARAARLTAARRREIAMRGAAARRASLEASRRIASNFRYLEAVRQLAPDVPKPRSVSTCRGPLPGVYPDGPGSHGR